MSNNRDDFSPATKELLANRVGRKCSNPACRKLTCGANEDPQKVTSIGVAAHICAAAKGGPRYDATMTSQERKSFENGIWLCQSCSKLIDTDVVRYTTSPVQTLEHDKELIQFFVQCFDRPAFQDDIFQEGRMEDFDKAIEDTIIALNTGVLRTRDGTLLKQAQGKSAIQNPIWREKFELISDMLASLRRRLKLAEKDRAYSKYGTGEDISYCFSDHKLAEWFNLTREEILEVLSSMCKDVGLHELKFRCRRYRW